MAIVNVIVMYGTAIRKAIAAKADVKKLKSMAKQAKETLRKQGDLPAALKQLERVIAKLEASKKKTTKKR